MSLNAEQLKMRDGRITASFLPSLMAGDTPKIVNEWRRLIGDPNYEPDDLSHNWPVQFGSFIETFALDWHQRVTGQPLTLRGHVVIHPDMEHVCCTLDAFREFDRTAIDCKAIGAYRKLDDVIPFYAPQMVAQKACTKASAAALLIVHGGSEPAEHPVIISEEYESAVWERVAFFWGCVSSLQAPGELPAATVPVAPELMITMDMEGNNSWSSNAVDWLANKDSARTFETAAKSLKELVAPNVKLAHGHGIQISRSNAGSLTIRKGN